MDRAVNAERTALAPKYRQVPMPKWSPKENVLGTALAAKTVSVELTASAPRRNSRRDLKPMTILRSRRNFCFNFA